MMESRTWYHFYYLRLNTIAIHFSPGPRGVIALSFLYSKTRKAEKIGWSYG